MSEKEAKEVKATVITGSDNNEKEKSFVIYVQKDSDNNSSHLNSLRNCVNRLQTQLNQYLTEIIDEQNTNNSNNTPINHNKHNIKDEDNDLATDDDNDDNQSEEPKLKKCKNK
jgi:hypothetical protein